VGRETRTRRKRACASSRLGGRVFSLQGGLAERGGKIRMRGPEFHRAKGTETGGARERREVRGEIGRPLRKGDGENIVWLSKTSPHLRMGRRG